jgi:ADP-ribose pyrophosphatase
MIMPKVTKRIVEYETPWFQVIAKTVTGLSSADRDEKFYVVKPDDYVTILAVTYDNQILLVRQYRPVVEDYTLELPSGHVEGGESPAEAARRELLEETGYKASDVELLGCLVPDTGRLANRLWCYFAPNVVPSVDAQTLLEERIELIICSMDDLARYIAEAQFNHALNLAAVCLAILKGKLPLMISRTT